MLCRMGAVVEAPIPRHITGIYVFTVVNLLAMLCISRVDAEIIVKDLLSNETAAVYTDLQAKFGPDFPSNGLEGHLVYADPDPQACGSIKPPPSVEDKYSWILLVARGGNCHFADKVLNAQFHNYSAVIVHNSEHKDGRISMVGGNNGSKVKIPSTFIGWTDGMELRRLYDYYTHREYIIKIIEDESVDYSGYLWPFLLVMAICILVVMIFLLLKFLRDYAGRRLSRLSNRHLKKLPVRKFKKGDYYDTCAICLEEYQEGEKIRVLPCEHVYHRKCIDPWLTKNKKTCPVCKRRVIPGRDADSESGSEGENGGTATRDSENTPLLRERPLQHPVGSGTDATIGHTLYTSGSTIPGDSVMGAVGGAEVLDRDHHHLLQAHGVTGRGNIQDSRERKEVRLDRKRKKQDRNRRTGREGEAAIFREEEEEAGTTSVSDPRGRRERRKRRKDKKKGDRGDVKEGHETEGVGDKKTAERNVHKNELTSSSVPGVRETSAERQDEQGSYINPSYSESHEIVLPVSASRRELNEVV